MRRPFALPFEDSLAHPRRNGNCRFYESLAESLAETWQRAWQIPQRITTHYFSGTRYARMKRRQKRGIGRGRQGKERIVLPKQAGIAIHARPNLGDGIAQNRVGTTPSSTRPPLSLPRPRVPICLLSLDCPADFPSSRDCGRPLNAR